MTWFRIDDSFHTHPKVDALADGQHLEGAICLFTLAGCWCAQHLTDGAMSAGRVRRFPVLSPNECAEELVRVGLWEHTDDGYLFHDWSDWNPTREDVLAKREKERERKAGMRRSKARSTSARTPTTPRDPLPRGVPAGQPECPSGTTPVVRSTSALPVPTRPDPSRPTGGGVGGPPPPPSHRYDDAASRLERDRAEAASELRKAWDARWCKQTADPGAPRAQLDEVSQLSTWLVEYRMRCPERSIAELAAAMVNRFFDVKLNAKKPKRRPPVKWLAEDPGLYLDGPDPSGRKTKPGSADAREAKKIRDAEVDAVAPPPEALAAINAFVTGFAARNGSGPSESERRERLDRQAEALRREAG